MNHAGHGGGGRHSWLMVACCVPMLVIAVVLAATGVVSWSFLIFALGCTAMMFFMMRGMHGGAPPTPQDASPTDADASTKAHHHDTHPR